MNLFTRFYLWRIRNIKDKQYMMILSVVIGILAGTAAFVLKNSVHFIKYLLTYRFSDDYQNYLFLAYPLIGILLTVIFAKFILRNKIRSHVSDVLYAISRQNGILKRHSTFSTVIGSALTVGFGGSVGLEGPTVVTGASLASNLSRFLRLNYKQVILMLGCASAGAMSAIFKAPIAGVVFALEVIMLDLTMSSIVPLLLASATAALTSFFFFGQDVLYNFSVAEKFHLSEILYFLLLGVLCGLASAYFIRIYKTINGLFDKIASWWIKLAVGGVILGALIFMIPALYGEGYESVNQSLRGDYNFLFEQSLFYEYRENSLAILLMFMGIVFLKAVATSITLSVGGAGGFFAPTLFLGANIGFLYAKTANYFSVGLSESNFALVGMAGLISGVIHAPLTAIFLIAELTNGYELFLPLMLVSTSSFAITKFFAPHSIYTYDLASRGDLITHDKDKAVLSMMRTSDLIETNFLTVHPDDTLRTLVDVISKSTRNVFPVVDKENNFLGVVFMDHVRHIIFKPEFYDSTRVRDLMYMPEQTVEADDCMEDVAHKFMNSGNFNL
ncbi:MAG: chloride channel protein, partial [Bacteroidetes bacterium]|nr:chloride channel protein [Bacteroidota bacterium]